MRRILLVLFLFTACNYSIITAKAYSPDSLNVSVIDTLERFTISDASALLLYDTLDDGNVFVKDSPIFDMLDSLATLTEFTTGIFTTDTASLNIYHFDKDAVPDYPDTVYQERIEKLDAMTPINLVYNSSVKRYIQVYAMKKRELTSKILGLAEVYFPLFEEHLDRLGLPLELKYLAVVESALNPRAGSRAGAKGLWQFMYGTGKVYGLKVTSFQDERYDPLKSTIAACEHLKDLYEIYGNWSLALAAYNSGAGNVNKAIRRSGGIKSYWAVQPFLPRETRGYVPAFIAVNYIMNYASEHNIYPVHPGILFSEIDTVCLKDVLAFDQIHEMLGVPMEDIRFLNPAYTKDFFPVTDKENHYLRLPDNYIGDFINNEDSIYNFVTRKGLERKKLLAEIKKAGERHYHYVRSGECLGSIASKYHCRISDIKRWNKLRSNTIYPKQRLIVYAPSYSYSSKIKVNKNGATHIVKSGETLGLIAKAYGLTLTDLKKLNNISGTRIYPGQKLIVKKDSKDNSVSEAKAATSYKYYTIQKGDTLWDIAKKFNGVSVDQIKQLNNISNSYKLKPGQKIRIAPEA